MLMLRIRSAKSGPIMATTCAKLMFSSCSPISALAAGVKIGSGKRDAFFKPAGSGTPHTDWLSWYSFHPLPAK